MKILYKTNKLEKVCTVYSAAVKEYGPRQAELIYRRLQEIEASDSVDMMIQYGIGRCHPLKGNRKGEFAVDLEHPYRLIFVKVGNDLQLVKIIEISDYH